MLIISKRTVCLLIAVCAGAVQLYSTYLPYWRCELSNYDASLVVGQGAEDPCTYRILTLTCSAGTQGLDACAPVLDPPPNAPLGGCGGSCAAWTICDGTDLHTVCRTGAGPAGLEPTLSDCSDDDTMTCGIAYVGSGACFTKYIWENNQVVGFWCKCDWTEDPSFDCEDDDLDNVETDCEGGGVPV